MREPERECVCMCGGEEKKHRYSHKYLTNAITLSMEPMDEQQEE